MSRRPVRNPQHCNIVNRQLQAFMGAGEKREKQVVLWKCRQAQCLNLALQSHANLLPSPMLLKEPSVLIRSISHHIDINNFGSSVTCLNRVGRMLNQQVSGKAPSTMPGIREYKEPLRASVEIRRSWISARIAKVLS